MNRQGVGRFSSAIVPAAKGREQGLAPAGNSTRGEDWIELIRLAFDHGDRKLVEAKEAHAEDLRLLNGQLVQLIEELSNPLP